METIWEDSLLERKTEGDLKDLLKTMVAFANSVHPDHQAIILIGEKDDGTIAGVSNPDNIQKTVRETAKKIYPDITWRSSVYEVGGKHCVRVEIAHSGNTPHFGGKAWVRRGSVTEPASEEVFQWLVENRLEKVKMLNRYLNKVVTVTVDNSSLNWGNPNGAMFGNLWVAWSGSTLVEVNKHWITLMNSSNARETVSTHKFYLDFDHQNNRLKICVIFSGIIL